MDVERIINDSLQRQGLGNLDNLFDQYADKHSDYHHILQRRYAIEKELPTETLLFLGMNPSFDERKAAAEGTEKRGFYYTGFDNSYFSRMRELVQSVSRDLRQDIPFAHHDIYCVRNTSQAEVLKMRDALPEFFRIQATLTKEVILHARPRMVVVCNAEACRTFQSEAMYDMFRHPSHQWDELLGTDWLPVEGTGRLTPVLFTGMLSGQRALDNGSYFSLAWHIRHILRSLPSEEESKA